MYVDRKRMISKLIWALITAYGVSQLGCKTVTPVATESDNPASRIDLLIPDSSVMYFPMASSDIARDENGKINAFSNQWYSKHLYTMHEPVLYTLVDSLGTYRFTHWGTWSRPYMMRVTLDDSLVVITKKVTNGLGGYNEGQLTYNISKHLKLSDWTELKSKLNKLAYWDMQTHGGTLGNDGSRWILEGYNNGQYHVVTRWTPDHYGPKDFAKVCTYFESLFEQQP